MNKTILEGGIKMNKKLIAILLGAIFIISAIPNTVEGQTNDEEPWIQVYEGRLEVEESVNLGNYKVKMTESETNNNPHIIISDDGEVQTIEQVYFGVEIETENLKVVPGKETDDGFLIIVKHKAELAEEISVEEGEKYSVENYEIQAKGVSNEELNITISNRYYSIESESTAYHKNLALRYDDEVLSVYSSSIKPDINNMGSGVELDLSAIGLENEAGKEVSFPVELTSNKSDKVVELDIIDKPDDWEAYFEISDEKRVKLLSLKEDISKTVNLIVESPRDALLGEHKIKFSANGNKEEVSVFVYETFRGEPAELTMNVEDDSGPVNNAEIEIGDETFITNSEGSVEIEKEPGEYNIKVSKEGYETETDTIELLDGEETSEMVRIERSSYYFDSELESTSLTVRFDSQQPYEITIDNKGKLNDEYSLKLKGLPTDWSHSFFKTSKQSVRTNNVEIDSGETKSVFFKAVPTYNSEPGEYNATLIVEGSGQTYKKNITIELIGNYQLDVNFSNYQVSGKAGDTITTDVMIRNYGSAPITNINFEIDGPDGWETTIEPKRITNLNRGDQRRATLEIQIPEGTPSGEQRIGVKTNSDQVSSSTSLRVQVTQSSNTALIGIGVLAIAIGGVVVLMKRVGRR